MSTPGTQRYSRLMLTLIKGGTKLTRRFVEKRVKDLSENGEEDTVDDFLLKNKYVILQQKLGKNKENVFFPRSGHTNLDNWDLCMFCFILEEICDPPHTTKMRIKKLLKIRNKLCHLHDPTLETEKFDEYFDDLKVSFEWFLKETNDEMFTEEMNELVQSLATDPLSMDETLKAIHNIYRSELTQREVLEKIGSGQDLTNGKLDTLIETVGVLVSRLPSGDSVTIPGIGLVIEVENCSAEEENIILDNLEKFFNEAIEQKISGAEEDLPNGALHTVRESVKEVFRNFFMRGRHIIIVKQRCLLLTIKCTSVKSFLEMIRDYRTGDLSIQLSGIETAIKNWQGCGNIQLVNLIFKEEFMEVMDDIVSKLFKRVKQTEDTVVQTGSNAENSIRVTLKFPTVSERETVQNRFETEMFVDKMNRIQSELCEMLNVERMSLTDKLVVIEDAVSNFGLEMAESSDIEMHIGRQVINRNYDALKKYLHPDPVIDCKTDFVLLTDTERNSIKDKDLTDKNDTLLKIVISKGAKGYTDFKERLRKTWQAELLELIVCAENGQDTNEMEGRLAELWYIKHKHEEEGEEEEDTNYWRDEIIEMNLKNHLIYISHCIKPDVLMQYLQCYTTDQKSDILAEKNPIRASRKALDMLFDSVEDQGRFAALRDALDRNGGYPKIVRILDGEYDPEDRNFVRIVELFAPELIGLIRPSELLPHLLSKGVFTQEDVQEITSEENNHGALRAACILLMYLPRRVVDWFRSFLNILIDCKLEDTAKMLDPDFYKVIMQEREGAQHHGICSIKHSSNAQKQKPKIKPKPKLIPSRDKDDDSEDEIEYTEFNEEELEYVLGNQKEREKLEEKMIYIDAKILWPERKQGEKQRILLRSVSKEEYRDACIWSRKRKMWKRNALKIFQDLFGQVKVSRNRCAQQNLSKIMSRKDNSSPSHKDCLIYDRRFKKVYTPTRSFCPNENPDEDTGARSSKESCQKREGDKETESDPEIVNSKDTEKIAECLMACGRRIFIMKGSLVDMGAEAVVNTTNKCLSFETGISKTIRDKGGSSIQAACHRFLQTQRSIDEGDTFVSGAGDLQAKFVIHVNNPVCDKNDSEEETLLKKTVGRVLMQASRKQARTIAIPAIGCGNSGWPAKTAAPLIIGAVRNFFREEQDSSVRHVYLVDLISKTTERFHQALCDTFNDDDKCVIESSAS